VIKDCEFTIKNKDLPNNNGEKEGYHGRMGM